MDLEEIKVAKKPRKAFDEWIQMTGQHAILKRQFPQYNLTKEESICVKYGLSCLTQKRHHIWSSIEKSMRNIN